MAAWVDTPGPNTRESIKNDVEVPVPGVREVLIKLEHTRVWLVFNSLPSIPRFVVGTVGNCALQSPYEVGLH